MALSTISAASSMNQAGKQAKAVVAQGNVALAEKAKSIRYAAAKQTTSFLNSGLTLEGTPNTVIGETFDTGLLDLKNMSAGYNSQAKNIIGQARADAIGKIASGFGSAAMGGSMGSMFSTGASYLPDNALFNMNNAGFGNTAYSAFDIKDSRL